MADKRPLLALTEYRKTSGKTQADLATDFKVAEMTVSRWETGDRKIGVKSLPSISEKTGIPREKLRPDIFGECAAMSIEHRSQSGDTRAKIGSSVEGSSWRRKARDKSSEMQSAVGQWEEDYRSPSNNRREKVGLWEETHNTWFSK